MKEWNGNKKSVEVMLGMSTTWHPDQRAEGDYYTTDPKAVLALLCSHERLFGFIKTLHDNVIWEPACGCGNISKVFEENGFEVISTDLFDRGYGIPGIDFLNVEKIPEQCTTIITNPPYKYANEFIQHSLELLPSGGIACFFLNLSYLSGLKRYNNIYRKFNLREVIVFSNRVHCYKNNIKTGHSSPVNYGWFVFQKGYNDLPCIRWTAV